MIAEFKQLTKRMEMEDDKLVGILKMILFHKKYQLAPLCSFLGGIVAQECVKYTGKFTPLNQWIFMEKYSYFGTFD